MFPYKGFAGKWLYVDLTTSKIEVFSFEPRIAEAYLGGSGFGTRLLWEKVPPQTDALSPENFLIFSVGPLCGTLFPNSSRVAVIAKSPLSGIYGDSNSGGFWGPELKFAGWDALVVVGKSPKPVYLLIQDDHAVLCDASGLWGLTTSETERAIRSEQRDAKIKVAAIGPAGENLVRFAGIQFTPQRSAARVGMGAVMGSKRLKAVVVRGHGPVRVADTKRFHQLSVSFHQRLRQNPIYEAVTRYGTPGITSIMNVLGRFPTRNFQLGSFPESDRIDAEALERRAFVRHLACFNCPVGCDKLFRVPDGDMAGLALRSVEYENVNALGGGIWNGDLDQVLYLNRICDEMGMDVISAGRTISFAMELWEKEILDLEDTGGIPMHWGDVETTARMLVMIAKREGFGALLGEGVKRAAEKIGRGAEEFAMHVKGVEIPGQDGRAQKSMGLAHATSSRGADHLKAFPTIDETNQPDDALRRYGEAYLPEMANPLETKHKPFLIKDGEDFCAAVDAVGVCKSGGTNVFTEFYWEDIAEAIEAATGMEMPVARLKEIGERIYNLQRCYNVLHGITRADDRLPRRFSLEANPSGNARGSTIDLEPMLDEYYDLRGWECVTGYPSKETLMKLGLKDAWQRLSVLRKASASMM